MDDKRMSAWINLCDIDKSASNSNNNNSNNNRSKVGLLRFVISMLSYFKSFNLKDYIFPAYLALGS